MSVPKSLRKKEHVTPVTLSKGFSKPLLKIELFIQCGLWFTLLAMYTCTCRFDSLHKFTLKCVVSIHCSGFGFCLY